MVQKNTSHGKGWLRRLMRIVATLIVVGVAFSIFAVAWLVPTAMRLEVRRRLSHLCEGPVRVERVQTDYSGRIAVEGVQFQDKEERRWLSAEKMTIALADWPGFRPSINTVQIDGLELRLSVENGKLLLPNVHWPKPSEGSGLGRLEMSRATITLANTNGEKAVYEDVTLSVSRTMNGNYEFVLKRTPGEGSEVIVAQGDVNAQSFDFDISLEIKHQLTKTEMTAVCTALNVPKVSAEGGLEANLKVTGNLNKPRGFQSSGNIELSDCVLFFQERVLASDLTASAQLDGQRLDVNEFTAMMCGGPVKGKFRAEVKDEQFIEYQGQVRAKDVNYPEFTSVLMMDSEKAARGTFAGDYAFSRRNDSKARHGEGVILLNDIDVSVLPVIPVIFQFVGLSRFEPLKTSDAEAKFRHAGSLVTVESGHISNLFAAIEFEPGGTVDLHAEQIDGYVVAAPLGRITGMIERLPVINIFSNLKDKLMRLHVKGHWSDPPSKLIRKEPIQDIKESTLGFIRDAAKTGGQFGQEMIDRLGGLLKTNKNRNK
ncbi:MAG: hypothetical protein A2Z25_04030 [Planctomycetes bacterium RBG_16_55_9]|nr:MAG: hypothetical protein A2Z25_04030 [Planctomycetes bacterium RBG_16_55_9]